MGAPTPHPVGRTHDVRLGVAIPATVTGQSLARALAWCVDRGIGAVELSAWTLESILGVPVPTVPLEPPAADGVELGLLELEEDVLRDSYDLAKQTFDAQLRAWRRTVALAPLSDVQRIWRDAGVSIDIVSVPDLIRWSDDEVDYACRAARAAGARVLATRSSLAGPRRLGPFARRHEIALSFVGDGTTGGAELARLLSQDDQATVAIDVGAWTAGGHGPLLPFLREHAARVSHVRLPAGDRVNDARVNELRDAVRENAWTFTVIVSIEGLPNHGDT